MTTASTVQTAGKLLRWVLRLGRKTILPWAGIFLGGSLLSILGFAFGLGPLLALTADWGFWRYGLAGLFAAAYLLGAPILYYYLGRLYGLMNGLHTLLKEGTAGLWQYLLQRYLAYLEARGKSAGEGGPERLARRFEDYLRRLDNVPRLLRPLARFLARELPFVQALEQSARELRQEQLSAEALAKRMAPRLSASAAALLAEPDPIWFWLLAGLQTGVVVLLWLL